MRLFAVFSVTLFSAFVAASDKPNILLLMAEDLSPRIGTFGDSIAQTPHINALAEQGVRFTNVFTTAGVCAPSRAATVMGMHQISFGAQHMRTSREDYLALPPVDAKAFPELLRRLGYFTLTDGKLDFQFSGTVGGGPFTIWDLQGRDISIEDAPLNKPFFAQINFPITHESGVFPPLGSWPNSVTHFVMQVMRLILNWSAPEGTPVAETRQRIPARFGLKVPEHAMQTQRCRDAAGDVGETSKDFGCDLARGAIDDAESPERATGPV